MFCIYLLANYSEQVFTEYINTLKAIFHSYSCYGPVFPGDMKAEFSLRNNRSSFRDIEFSKFIIETNISLVNATFCKGPSCTYLTSEKLLDNVVHSQ